MNDFLFSAVSCLSFFQLGLCAAECSQAVLGARRTFHVCEGGSLTLSCVVQHCERDWTKKWKWKKLTNESSVTVEESSKLRFSTVELTANETRLELKLLSIRLSDSGSYRCEATWIDGSGVGHWMEVNVTKAVPARRSVLHRVLVCSGAFLCLPVILGLARCLSSKVKPQPHPRKRDTYSAVHRDRSRPPPQPSPRRPVPNKRSASTHTASPNSQQKIEVVVYADISQDALRQPEVRREPVQSTVYSSVRFS